MEFTIKIIFILILIIVLVTIINLNIGFNDNTIERFKNIHESDYFQRLGDIKKSKITKKTKYEDKDDYNDLEVKIPSTDPVYFGLNNYLKKYEINFIYNLEKLNENFPLVITYDNQSVRNDKNESFVNFLKGLNHYRYNFIVCGINTKWDGWYGRYKTYLELLEQIPPSQLIFITDSRDVLVNNSPHEFIENYNKLIKIYNDETKSKIVFGTEVGCCVNQMWHYSPGTVFKNKNQNVIDLIKEEVKNKINSQTSVESEKIRMNEIELTNSTYNLTPKYSLMRTDEIYQNGKKFPWDHWVKWNNLFIDKFLEANTKYNLGIKDYKKYPIIKLNFGLMVGICSSVLKFLQTIDLRVGEDDQHLASEFFYSRPEMVILDYTQILLSNTGYKHSFRKCTSKTMNNTHYNVNFNDHLNEHDEYVDFNVYTREDIPEQGIMYGFDIQSLKYFFTYENIISYPSFIQSPGKDWNCYNELLYKLPYCDEKMCSYYYNLEKTQKYNIRDIVVHEYKNQLGDIKIKWILDNLLNPLYWALNMYIVKDIYEIMGTEEMKKTNTFMLLDSGNLMGWYRFNSKLSNQHIMPWDDDFDLGWYSKNIFSKETIDIFFKLSIKRGYEIFIYYKEIGAQYSASEPDHYTIRLNSQNILQIPALLHKYEIVLFNISIGTSKYKEILKQFNMSIEYEEKYLDGNVKIPSIDIFMYELNPISQEYEYKKIFGVGYSISIPKKYIEPIKNDTYNKIQVQLPSNPQTVLNIVYTQNYTGNYKNLDLVVIKRHTSLDDKEDEKEIEKINKMSLSINDKDILLITKIFNNFINKYYQIINSNDTIKKIISTK
jgi:hypothetical protein